MAKIETRGYINKFERKESGKGPYCKFQLATQQKRKDKSGTMVTEKLYLNCVDFTGKDPPGLHTDSRDGTPTAYVGIKGYLTITGWAKDGKGGANVDVTVTEYEELEQNNAPAAAKAATAAPPADPFALDAP
jgi:hypothetical protein